MSILPLQKKHRKGLADLLVSYWKGRGMDYSREWALRYVTEGHRTEILGERFFVAVEAGEVVGSMSVILWEGKRAELRDFYVKPEFRQKGVGERLFERAMGFCKQQGAGKVFAFVLPQAAEFFLKRGFEKEGVLRAHAKKGEDLVAIGRFLK